MVTDILLLLVLVMAFYKGWTKGLIMALFVFVSYFIALALAFQFSGLVQGYLKANGTVFWPSPSY